MYLLIETRLYLLITPVTIFVNCTLFYMYSNTYFFYFVTPITYSFLFYDKSANLFFFRYTYSNSFYNTYFKIFNNTFHSFFFPFFKKLKFKGKGYYIFKNFRNTITFKFGYSHRLYVYSYMINVKFISKTVTILFGVNNKDLLYTAFELYNTRTRNIFTGKGIRFSKQIIYKKVGKISSYR